MNVIMDRLLHGWMLGPSLLFLFASYIKNLAFIETRDFSTFMLPGGNPSVGHGDIQIKTST